MLARFITIFGLAAALSLGLTGCQEADVPTTDRPGDQSADQPAKTALVFEHGRPIPLGDPDDVFEVDPRSSAPFPTTLLHFSFDHADDGKLTELKSGVTREHAGTTGPGPAGRAFTPPSAGFAYTFDGTLEDEWSLFVRFESSSEKQEFLTLGDALQLTSTKQGVRVSTPKGTIEVELESGWHWLGVSLERILDRGSPSLRVSTANGVKRTDLEEFPKLQLRETLTLKGSVAIDELRIERGVLSTLAHSRLDDPPRPQVRRPAQLDSGQGPEDIELWSIRATEPVLSGSELVRHAATDHFLTDETGLTWTRAQWLQHDTDLGPRPRTTHPTISLGDGKVWIFGGETRDSDLWPQWNDDDTWIYDTAGYSWRRIPEHENWPGARAHFPASFWPAGNQVWFRGGWFNSEQAELKSYNDVWTFDVATDRWSQWEDIEIPFLSDNSLVSMSDGSLGLMLLSTYSEVFDLANRTVARREPARIQELDGAELALEQVVSSAHAFDPTRGHVVVFGGESGLGEKTFHTETMTYDPEDNLYVKQSSSGPAARSRPGFARDSKRDRFVMFGGVRGHQSQRFDDLWVLDGETLTWQELDCANRPSRRGGFFGMAYDEASDAFYLVHGRHSFTHFLDEVWQLNLRDEATATAAWCFDVSAGDFAKGAFVRGHWSDQDTVELTLASSTDGIRFTSLPKPEPDARYVRLTVHATSADPDRPVKISKVGFGSAEATENGPRGLALEW